MLRLKTILWGGLIVLAQLCLAGCQGPQTAFYAFADLPYSESEVEKLKNGVEAINRDAAYDFSVHLGDIKAGKDSCEPASNPPDPNQLFFDTLKEVATSFEKPVLFMHGDGHVLEIERFLADNLLRLELNGGTETDWLMKVVVTPGKEQPFGLLLPVP